MTSGTRDHSEADLVRDADAAYANQEGGRMDAVAIVAITFTALGVVILVIICICSSRARFSM